MNLSALRIPWLLYDLVIIGAGPAGLTAGIYARTRKLKTLIIDATVAGGQLASLYPDKGIDNYPGYVMTDAGQLSTNLINHASEGHVIMIASRDI